MENTSRIFASFKLRVFIVCLFAAILQSDIVNSEQLVSNDNTKPSSPTEFSHFTKESESATNVSRSGNIQTSPPHPLRITMQISRPVLLFNLNSKTTVKMNYTLRCDHPTTVYRVMAKSINVHISAVIAGNPQIIRCAARNTPDVTANQSIMINSKTIDNTEYKNIISEPDLFDFEVSGEFEMTFESKQIGRSPFLMFAAKINGPGSGITKPQIGAIGAGNASLVAKTGFRSTSASAAPSHLPGKPAGGKLPPNTVIRTMILVMQMPRAIDQIFRVLLYVVIICATTAMGVKVEFPLIVKVMKKPLGPCIGLACQFLCMPLIAYLVAKTVPQPSPAISLGIFACGVAPGGGASNFYCYLLGGDVSLSVTMTTISSVLALGMIPLWMFTLGETFSTDTVKVFIPYTKVLESLALVVLPVFVGMFIKYKAPKIAKLISKILKPFLLVAVIVLMSFGIYANFYIFSMIRPMQILAGCLLPYVGYLVGGGVAMLACQSWSHVKTIAIETGIQNAGIPFMILLFSLTPPDNQLAVIAPAASAIMTPIPLIFLSIGYIAYHRCRNKKNDDDGEGENDKDTAQMNGEENGNAKGLLQSAEDDVGEPEPSRMHALLDKLMGKKPKSSKRGEKREATRNECSKDEEEKWDLNASELANLRETDLL